MFDPEGLERRSSVLAGKRPKSETAPAEPAAAPPTGSAVDPGIQSAPSTTPDAGSRPLRLNGRGKVGSKPATRGDSESDHVAAEQRLKILDLWQRSGLPAGEFAPMVNVSKHTLYDWQKRFNEQGPAGLLDRPRGAKKGSRLPELTKRTVLMMKRANPTWGAQRISDMLVRGPALFASPGAVARVLKEAGYEPEFVETSPHGVEPKRFERARANQLWQTDLFTFTLKRQNRRVYLVAFMDDHSRFIVSYGLHAVGTTPLVIEALAAGIASYQVPEEVLTDNGPQYVTWRGRSAFGKELEKRGVKQIVASPRRPQTLGKIERFWSSLWTECVEKAIFLDLEDARRRIGLYIDYYNFQRTHQGIDGLVPADRFFGAAEEIKRTLAARVAANALELARQGIPRKPFYLTGQVGGQSFSVHGEGERLILKPAGAEREEIELVRPEELNEPAPTLPEPVCPQGAPPAGLIDDNELAPEPGVSPMDELEPPDESDPDASLDTIEIDEGILSTLEDHFARRRGGDEA